MDKELENKELQLVIDFLEHSETDLINRVEDGKLYRYSILVTTEATTEFVYNAQKIIDKKLDGILIETINEFIGVNKDKIVPMLINKLKHRVLDNKMKMVNRSLNENGHN